MIPYKLYLGITFVERYIDDKISVLSNHIKARSDI